MRVYLSSTKGTTRVTTALATDLKQEGFDVLLPGSAHESQNSAAFHQILSQIVSADCFVVIVGEREERSPQIEREWFEILERVSDRTRKLVSVLVGSAELPNFLKHWPSARIDSPKDSKQWSRLLESVTHALNSDKVMLAQPRKADILARQQRLESIGQTAIKLKELGM